MSNCRSHQVCNLLYCIYMTMPWAGRDDLKAKENGRCSLFNASALNITTAVSKRLQSLMCSRRGSEDCLNAKATSNFLLQRTQEQSSGRRLYHSNSPGSRFLACLKPDCKETKHKWWWYGITLNQMWVKFKCESWLGIALTMPFIMSMSQAKDRPSSSQHT